jgi:hypothetical protein
MSAETNFILKLVWKCCPVYLKFALMSVVDWLPTTNRYLRWQGNSVPSADDQSLIPVTKVKYMNRSPIVLRPPKLKLKESAEDEFVPSPSHICNTRVMCRLSQESVYEKIFL